MYTVEIRRHGESLGEPMAQMRTRLDHHCICPPLVELASTPTKELCFRLTFASGPEATAFAQEFGGKALGDQPTFAA
jgi:hypothetical protein